MLGLPCWDGAQASLPGILPIVSQYNSQLPMIPAPGDPIPLTSKGSSTHVHTTTPQHPEHIIKKKKLKLVYEPGMVAHFRNPSI